MIMIRCEDVGGVLSMEGTKVLDAADFRRGAGNMMTVFDIVAHGPESLLLTCVHLEPDAPALLGADENDVVLMDPYGGAKAGDDTCAKFLKRRQACHVGDMPDPEDPEDPSKNVQVYRDGDGVEWHLLDQPFGISRKKLVRPGAWALDQDALRVREEMVRAFMALHGISILGSVDHLGSPG